MSVEEKEEKVIKEKKAKKNILEKLQECRIELQKKNLKKTGENKFAGFKYYELADILPTINELFLEHKIFSEFNIENDNATLVITNIENPEEKIVFRSPTAEANIKGCTPVQSLGGIHTYLKRYLYINALEIVENDMFDGKAGNMELETSKPMTEAQKDLLNSLSLEQKQKIIAKYGTTNLTFQQASKVLKEYK